MASEPSKFTDDLVAALSCALEGEALDTSALAPALESWTTHSDAHAATLSSDVVERVAPLLTTVAQKLIDGDTFDDASLLVAVLAGLRTCSRIGGAWTLAAARLLVDTVMQKEDLPQNIVGECVKVLGNVLLVEKRQGTTQQPIFNLFQEANFSTHVQDRLLQAMAKDTPLDRSDPVTTFRWTLVRTLFLLCLQDEVCNALDRVAVLQACHRLLDVAVEEDDAVTDTEHQCGLDALKLIFNLTKQYGPLGDKGSSASICSKASMPDAVGNFWDSMPPMLNAILGKPQGEKWDPFKLFGVNVTLNMPAECLLSFDFPTTFPRLLQLLVSHIKDATFLTPLLMLLTNIATLIPAARGHMLVAMFPNHASIPYQAAKKGFTDTSAGVRVPEQHKGTLAEPLIAYMCSSNPALKHYSCELAWQLCEQSPDDFSRLVGWGTAVGHLTMRGITALGQPGQGKLVAERRVQDPSMEHVSREDREEWDAAMAHVESSGGGKAEAEPSVDQAEDAPDWWSNTLEWDQEDGLVILRWPLPPEWRSSAAADAASATQSSPPPASASPSSPSSTVTADADPASSAPLVCDCNASRLRLTWRGPGASEDEEPFVDLTLFADIVPQHTRVSVKDGHVCVVLAKVYPNMPWARIFRRPGESAPTQEDFDDLMTKMDRLQQLGVIRLQGKDGGDGGS